MITERTFRRVGLVAGTSLLALAAIGPAASPALAKASGSIQTTSDSCAVSAPQNDNSYASGETVYVRGTNFAASSAFTWTITGKPGGASGDPNQNVTTGNGTTDAAGTFCVAAYVIAADDWGEYSVKVEQGSTKKNDNYSVEQLVTEDTTPPADEETPPPADDTIPPAEETTPPADQEVTPPVDDTTPPADEETTPPADEETTPPADEETTPPADEQTTPPADDPTVEIIDDADTPPPAEDETTPPSEEQAAESTDVADTTPEALADPAEDANEGSDDTVNQEVLGAVSGGPTITPPPTDTVVAPSDQGGGIDWRTFVAFFGVLILAATIGLPERRRLTA